MPPRKRTVATRPIESAEFRCMSPRRRAQVWILPALAAWVLLGLGAHGLAFAAAKATIVDRGKVYYGAIRKSTNPAAIQRMKVYREIPAYRRIREGRLNPSDANYHFWIAEASRVFRESVKRVADSRGFDLVAEADAIVARDAALTDITEEVIRRIKGEP